MEFFDRFLPFAVLISQWTKSKAEFVGLEGSPGLYPSVILSEVIYKSNWGKHPIAQTEITIRSAKKESHRYSNNLALLQVGKEWKGKSNDYEGLNYRAYKDWHTFAVDYSDYLVFSRELDHILIEEDPNKQLKLFALTKYDKNWHNISMYTLNLLQDYLDGQ